MTIEGIKHKKSAVTGMLILFLVSFLQYAPSLGNDFVWDAKGVFVVDPSIKSIANIPHFFTQASPLPGLKDAVGNPTTMLQYYRPVMKTVHSLEYAVFGERPVGYNAVSNILNAVAVVLAFLLIRAISGDDKLAFLASLLYAVNPARVEAVSWVYSDSYILTAIFTFLALLLYHRGRVGFSLGVYAVALFTHESAVLLPAIIVLYEFLIQKKRTAREFVRTVPFFLVLALFIVLRRFIVGPTPLTHVGGITFVNTAVVIIKRYVKLFLVPDAPVTVYRYAAGMFAGFSPEVVVSYCAAAALAAFGVFLWFRNKEHLFWYLWFFLFASLSLNVGQLGEYLMAEKLLYTASLGFCLVLTLPVAAQGAKRWMIVPYACLVLFHFGTTIERQQYWKNTTTYLEQALAFAPDFAFGRWALADEYKARHDLDRSLAEFQKALALQPLLLPVLRDPMASVYYLKGNDLSEAREYERALEEYQLALAWHPDHSPSLSNIGIIYYLQGKNDKAVRAWEEAIRADPSNAQAYYNMGMGFQNKGDIRRALECYRKYLALDKDPKPSVRMLVSEWERKFGK